MPIFNADEIFAIAEQIERNGAKFYRKAADLASVGDKRQVVLDLAAMEDEHERTFAQLRAELSGRDREPTAFDPEDQAALYLAAMADGYVFDIKDDPSEALTGSETLEDILQLAIGKEKDSIVFYVGIKKKVPGKLGGDRIDNIIDEEMSHITLLSRQLAGAKE